MVSPIAMGLRPPRLDKSHQWSTCDERSQLTWRETSDHVVCEVCQTRQCISASSFVWTGQNVLQELSPCLTHQQPSPQGTHQLSCVPNQSQSEQRREGHQLVE